jgi:hypothetical protein
MSHRVRLPLPLLLWLALSLLLGAVSWVTLASAQPVVDYSIVYSRSPRAGDTDGSLWPEVKFPFRVRPGTDLVLLKPDGAEEVLVPGGDGAILDPVVSFDAQWVYYAKIHNVRVLQGDYDNIPVSGSDIYKINLATRETVQLTFQEFTPNTGVADWSTTPRPQSAPGKMFLGYGVFNLGPCPLPGGKLAFTSSRNAYLPVKGFTFPQLQLFVLDETTRDPEGPGYVTHHTGFLNLGSALHPAIMTDGRIMFSSYESQGLRDERLWALWSIWPDGRTWEPLMSAFLYPISLHGHTLTGNGLVAVVAYYNQNNSSFGALLTFRDYPAGGATAPPNRPRWGSPNPNDPSNPKIQVGWDTNDGGVTYKPWIARVPFSPLELDNKTRFAPWGDREADKRQNMCETPWNAPGNWLGKVRDPAAAPADDVLLVWTPGPANDKGNLKLPAYNGGIFLLQGGRAVDHPCQLVQIKLDPASNAMYPKPVVPYKAIYGVDEPATVPWLPNDGTVDPRLPAGTFAGMVGTSSMLNRDVAPGVVARNWIGQGADTGTTDANIHAVRILTMEPMSHRARGGAKAVKQNLLWENKANERLRILGEIPVRKFDAQGQPVLDYTGQPDTSWLAKIPADVPFTFQTLDKHGLVLNMSQTWHQVRPGERRDNCGGCHAHNHMGVDMQKVAAHRPEYQAPDFTKQPPRDVEFLRDVKAVLEARFPETVGKTPQKVVADHCFAFRSRVSPLLKPFVDADTIDEQLTLIGTWMDLGCPISKDPTYGWFLDETRPTVAIAATKLTAPSCPMGCVADGRYGVFITVSMHDMNGLRDDVSITSNVSLQGEAPGTELVPLFNRESQNPDLWGELWASQEVTGGVLTVRVRDTQGNLTRRQAVLP